MDDADPIRQLVDLGEDVARHEDSDALVGELPEEAAYLDDAGGVEAVRGLVEDEELGEWTSARARERRCLFPSGQVGAFPVGVFF